MSRTKNQRQRPMNRTVVALTFSALTAASATVFANAPETAPRVGPAPVPEQARPVAASAGPRTPRKPHAAPGLTPQQTYLIRATLLALDDANQTGNYTVLRDRAGAAFRQKNSAADLAQTFHGFRQNQIGMQAVALVDPVLLVPAQRPTPETLILTGQVPLAPRAIVFELGFVADGGQWKLDQVAIGLAKPPQHPATP
jgi:hypothetical protein